MDLVGKYETVGRAVVFGYLVVKVPKTNGSNRCDGEKIETKRQKEKNECVQIRVSTTEVKKSQGTRESEGGVECEDERIVKMKESSGESESPD